MTKKMTSLILNHFDFLIFLRKKRTILRDVSPVNRKSYGYLWRRKMERVGKESLFHVQF